jgi:hypothetical protein
MCNLDKNSLEQIGKTICLSGEIENHLKSLANELGVSCLKVFRFINLNSYAGLGKCVRALDYHLSNYLINDLHEFNRFRNSVAHGKSGGMDLTSVILLGENILNELKHLENIETPKNRFEPHWIFYFFKKLLKSKLKKKGQKKSK